jgi:hypothetical protein
MVCFWFYIVYNKKDTLYDNVTPAQKCQGVLTQAISTDGWGAQPFLQKEVTNTPVK